VPIVTVAVPDVEILAGEIEQSVEENAEGTEQDNDTVPENEFSAVIERVVLPEEPRPMVIAEGLTDS
jgi:hypothetical protein